jgi:oligoendopeptidase F
MARCNVFVRTLIDSFEGDLMSLATRPTPEQFADATWEDIAPLFAALEAVELDPDDKVCIETWLDEWNALEIAVKEAAIAAEIAFSTDVNDPVREEANLRFRSGIVPKADERRVILARKLLKSGYTRPDLEVPLRTIRADEERFREENVPLQQELQALNARYDKIVGGMTVEWRGEEIPVAKLGPFLLDPDRKTREAAWRLQFKPYIDRKQELDSLFDEQIRLRQQIAHNAGFANYRDYAFHERYRFDYSPEDCFTFHDSVSKTFVPAAVRRLEKRREVMNLDTVRPWDTATDPHGRPALKPYDSVDELNDRVEAIFRQIDPVFGDYYRTMRKEELLDLESRKGKRPGGFCTTLPWRKQPFIFMNAAGTALDVQILVHEAGHAFHGFEASANLPLEMQNLFGEEIAEVASMSMELLVTPYLHRDAGGFFNDDGYQQGVSELLSGIIERFSWVSIVDAFQHWLYTDPDGLDREARDAKWLAIWNRFQPGIDWSGLEAERAARWHKQLHIFLYPFYYIEYALAQLGALQVWRNARRDQAKATADYRAALALGGTRPLPELYARAGARLIFDAGGMQELVDLVEVETARIEATR